MSKRLAKKVLLIGWDGADWQMIRPLIEQGKMPNLKALLEQGVSGNLATIQPILSPMLWNSIATGKRADKHGIYGFIEPKPDRSGVRPVTSTTRKCKALWNILSQSEMTSQVISWFASHPAEPINGSIVSDRFVGQTVAQEKIHDCPPGTFYPESLSEEMSRLVVGIGQIESDTLSPFVPQAAEIDQQEDKRLIKLASLVARTGTVQAAGTHLLHKNKDWDLTAIYFIGIDEFGHTFMPYRPPQLEGISEEDVAIYGDVMENCYRFHDMMLGAQLQLAGPDTTVILISDHGFKNDELRPGTDGMEDPTGWHRQYGIACLAGPGIKQGETLYGATILDVTPTILALLGLPVGDDMDGRPWLEIFDEAEPVERIPSWEDVEGDAGMHPEEVREDPSESAEAIKHLVDLGYIEAPGDNAEEAIEKCVLDQRTNLAQALTSSRRAVQSIPLWQELAADYPDQPLYKYRLALVYRSLNRMDECEETLTSLPQEWQTSIEVQSMRARIAYSRGDKQAASQVVKAILQSGLTDLSIANQMGRFLIEFECWEQAKSVFEQSHAAYAQNPVALDGLAQVYNEHDQFQEAAEHAIEAVSLQHYFPEAHFHLGVALRGLERNQDAISAFETSLSMGHEPIPTHEQLASLYRHSDPIRAQYHASLAGVNWST
jgi:predicted AlkP superfamily phosphohydrolase/phosphomutase/tetratricopeptide (TPR) repeat protein